MAPTYHSHKTKLSLFKITNKRSAMRAIIAWPMLILGLYMLAALIGSMIPVNAKWKPVTIGNTVYLYDNGVHTSLIVARRLRPTELGVMVADPAVDLPRPNDSPEVRMASMLGQLPDDRFPGNIKSYPFLMIGWGDTKFYRETPAWRDVRLGTALTALWGSGQSSMHVDRLKRLPTNGIKKLVLTEGEYLDLLGFVADHFPNSLEGLYTVEKGYGPDDRFYPISPKSYQHGTPELRYSMLFTCNNWVNEGLKRAGIKTGYWTPLPFGVMWWH
jgi:uncharacterized protein (TIGR02117 family)